MICSTIYQLIARGTDALDQPRTIFSKRLFEEEYDARQYVPEFEKKVTAGGLFDLNREGLEVSIEECELQPRDTSC